MGSPVGSEQNTVSKLSKMRISQGFSVVVLKGLTSTVVMQKKGGGGEEDPGTR